MRAVLFIVVGALIAMLWAVPNVGTARFVVHAAQLESLSAPPAASPTPPKATPEPEAEVIRVETDLVNSLFTATDKDRHFITSLRATDIAIFENDVPQTISLFERETDRPLSLALLIDTSDSQRGVLNEEKNAARAFVDSVIRPAKIGPRYFRSPACPKLNRTQQTTWRACIVESHGSRSRYHPRMNNESPTGMIHCRKSRIPAATQESGMQCGRRLKTSLSKTPDGTRRAIVLLSDGDDTSSTIKKQDVIDFAVKSDVAIYSIGFRDRDFPEGKLDTGALRKISDRTGGRAFFPTQPDELQASFAQIDQELRSQYLIGYSPTNKNRDGSYRRTRIEIINPVLRQNKAQLFYRQGYYAKRN